MEIGRQAGLAGQSAPALYEDQDWILVQKPIGISTHAPAPGRQGVLEWFQLHFPKLKLHPISRLDKETSGLMLIAKNKEASLRAEEIHHNHLSQKHYYFVSSHERAGVWKCELDLDEKKASTHFELIRSNSQTQRYLYRAKLTHGRRHQIRRHAQISGVPLLGDTEYGGNPWPRLCLQCYRIDWPELAPVQEIPLDDSLEITLGLSTSDQTSSVESDIALAKDRRSNWLPSVTDAYRLIHRGEFGQMDWSVDRYGSILVASVFENLSDQNSSMTSQMDSWLERLLLQEGLSSALIRCHHKNPHQKKLHTQDRVLGDPPPKEIWVREGLLSFQILPGDRQHLGLFLDQRDNRQRVFRASRGFRVANLFSFTGSFALAALKGEAEFTLNVDLAKGAHRRGQINLAHNGMDGLNNAKFFESDVRKWLDKQCQRLEREAQEFPAWDWVICDPPVFASSKNYGVFSVDKEWDSLAQKTSKILSNNGRALMINNHRSGHSRRYRAELDKYFKTVTPLESPIDFPEMDERTSVRAYLCEK